jgi:ascorbate-specific PTS system EIIC-type component UlaA
LFFVVTLVAVALGVYLHVSRVLALLAGGAWIVVAVVRWSGLHNLVLGGLLGFGTAAIVSVVIVATGNMHTSTSIGLLMLCPSAGYILGAFMAELRELY